MITIVTRTPPPTEFPPNFSQDLLSEINRLRANPSSYIPEITKRANIYNKYDVEEAIGVLRQSSPCSTSMRLNSSLNKVAQDWADLTGPIGGRGHGDLFGRVKPIVPTNRGYSFAENISYGYTDAVDTLVAWIVDQGVPNRGHRKNLLNCQYNLMGVGTAKHRDFRVVAVNTYFGFV